MDESQTQNRSFLAGKLVSELQAIAEQVGVKDPKKRKKAELIDAILGIAPQPSSSHAASPAGKPAVMPEVDVAARPISPSPSLVVSLSRTLPQGAYCTNTAAGR